MKVKIKINPEELIAIEEAMDKGVINIKDPKNDNDHYLSALLKEIFDKSTDKIKKIRDELPEYEVY